MRSFENRKARRLFHIEDEIEAGISLRGSEVKAVRMGRIDLSGSYATVEDGEVILRKMHIGQYEADGHLDHKPKRPRKLLLHKDEIKKLTSRVCERGYTLIPLRVYFNNKGILKVLLGLARGKKKIEKKIEKRRKDEEREISRIIKKELGS